MNIVAEFRCGKCGLLTPGTVSLPDDVDQRRRLPLECECLHCGHKMEETRRVSEWLAAMGETS